MGTLQAQGAEHLRGAGRPPAAGQAHPRAARRELFEETGAAGYPLPPICVYSVSGRNRVNATGEASFGMLSYAEITQFQALPQSERVSLFRELPGELTYPEIQPKLIQRVIDGGLVR